MNKGLVTVVIPVYGVERWLDRCVSSVAGQSYGNLELLLIDDGSPDNCPGMCDAWAQRDSRIRVIHKANAGLGMARNTGIEQARGEYLCFVDSDDRIEENTVAHAYAMAEKEQADVVVFGMTAFDRAENVTARLVPHPPQTVYTGAEVRERFLPELLHVDSEANLCLSACCCLISGTLIRETGWRFPSEREIVSEDVYALLGLYRHVQKVAVLEQAPYHYIANHQSLTYTYRADRFEKNKAFYRACIDLCRGCGYPKAVERRCAEPFLSYTITTMKQETAHNGIRALSRLKAMMEDPLLQQILREKQRDRLGWKKRLFFRCVRNGWYRLGYLLLSAQNRKRV